MSSSPSTFLDICLRSRRPVLPVPKLTFNVVAPPIGPCRYFLNADPSYSILYASRLYFFCHNSVFVVPHMMYLYKRLPSPSERHQFEVISLPKSPFRLHSMYNLSQSCRTTRAHSMGCLPLVLLINSVSLTGIGRTSSPIVVFDITRPCEIFYVFPARSD